jgi:Ohr subfamily peroxiredoxin
MKKLYETAMINHGGRQGVVAAPNGSMEMKLDTPGIHSTGTNPEQLFAAGYSSCFNGALQHVLKEAGEEADSEVKARVSLYQTDDGGYQIGVVMEVHIVDMTIDKVEHYLALANDFCPYSKATKGNIDVKLEIV